MKWKASLACLAFLATLFLVWEAFANTIPVGSVGLSGELLPLWVAHEKSLFRKYALDTEIITFQGDTLTIQSLLSGEIQFAVGGTSGGVNAKVGGADIMAIAEFINSLPYTLVASEKIRSADQLRGKKFAVSRLGAISDISLRIALRNLGINPEKEAIVLGVGNQSARFSALKSGTVDATLISPPLTITARKLGFNLITSFQQAGIKWAYDSIFVTNNFANKNRQAVSNFLKGFIEGMAYIRKNKEESLAVLSKWMRLNDREALEETYRYLLDILPRKPYSPDEGMQSLIDVIAATNPKAKKLRPQDVNNMSYLQELDLSGFIDRLYQ